MDEPTTRFPIQCPYCGESVDVFVEADLAGELVQDCEVCCNPWLLRIGHADAGPSVEVKRLDD